MAPLKGEGSLAPLGRSLGTGSTTGGTLGGGSLGTGSLGGGSLGRGPLGGNSLGSSIGKSPPNGSSGTGAKGGLGSGGRFPSAERKKHPFQQAPLGGIKDSPGVSKRIFLIHRKGWGLYYPPKAEFQNLFVFFQIISLIFV